MREFEECNVNVTSVDDRLKECLKVVFEICVEQFNADIRWIADDELRLRPPGFAGVRQVREVEQRVAYSSSRCCLTRFESFISVRPRLLADQLDQPLGSS